ncbi:MAG: UDP-N-acetylmuramoyl-tripeptide--D-alanyl-D-alanine ligase [Eubacterium sp.]|nr:UDP-N-acetylmuramoyl-tripeptide--D-alanyl-D-alanine ligase [Eubacterium sp.]
MRHITVRDILRVTEGTLRIMGQPDGADDDDLSDKELKDLCIDSREVKPGDLFIPLIGERVDAHRFIPEVMGTVTASLTDREPAKIYSGSEQVKEAEERKDILIKVADTQKALERIGAYIRTQYEPPVVGVTGSVGKTTTRRMIATALGSCREVYETPGNLNSHIGIPLATSRMLDAPSEIAVLEMGIDRIGEMDVEYAIVRPEIAVVTMIGVSHMEYLGSREGIRREKLKIAGQDTTLFLNADDPLLTGLRGKTQAREVLYYGFSESADYRAEEVEIGERGHCFTYVNGDTRIRVELPVLGKHNVRNALVAMAICDYLGMDLQKAAAGLAGFQGLRQIIRHMPQGTILIDDTYNASPESMRAALSVLTELEVKDSKWAVLGDMFELGSESETFHREVGRSITDYRIDHLVTVGGSALFLGEEAEKKDPSLSHLHFNNIEEAGAYLKKQLQPGDAILLKASHGMNFAKIVDELMA